MQTLTADQVWSPDADSLSHGEGWISFSWRDAMYGREGLKVELDGHCSRLMPIRSGYGLLDYTLCRDVVTLRFNAELAKKLELDEEVEIRFEIADDEFAQLMAAMNIVAGGGDCSSS